jgi:hypothetical protein
VQLAFNAIINDAQQLLSVFEAAKFRTVAIVDHSKNDKYPNLQQECISYFWNVTLNSSPKGNLTLYFSYDEEALARFGAKIYNDTLRLIFKHTTASADANIEDCVRINVTTSNVRDFYYSRVIDGENEFVNIQAVPYSTT